MQELVPSLDSHPPTAPRGPARYRALLGLTLLAGIIALPDSQDTWTYLDVLSYASTTLRGDIPHSDIATDFYGFRAMLLGKDAYAKLGPALATLGLNWDVPHASTHPPTAFLFVAAVAFLPWPLASLLWAWLMLGAIFASFLLAGYSRGASTLLTAGALFWPPASLSLGQLTPLWMLGIMLAYRARNSSPILAGFWIGIASLTKLLPAVLMAPFMLRRNWRAILGFALAWTLALAVLVALAPESIARYLEVNSTNALPIMLRADNASFMFFLGRILGNWGFALAFLLGGLLAALAAGPRFRARGETITGAEWNLFSFIAVALLPIAWTYSLLPLLPVLVSTIQRGGPARNPALWALLVPFVAPPFGAVTPTCFALFFVLCGVSLALAHPVSMETERKTNVVWE